MVCRAHRQAVTTLTITLLTLGLLATLLACTLGMQTALTCCPGTWATCTLGSTLASTAACWASYVELYSLNRTDLEVVLQQWPELAEQFEAMGGWLAGCAVCLLCRTSTQRLLLLIRKHGFTVAANASMQGMHCQRVMT
jgi:hypothetical protein